MPSEVLVLICELLAGGKPKWVPRNPLGAPALAGAGDLTRLRATCHSFDFLAGARFLALSIEACQEVCTSYALSGAADGPEYRFLAERPCGYYEWRSGARTRGFGVALLHTPDPVFALCVEGRLFESVPCTGLGPAISALCSQVYTPKLAAKARAWLKVLRHRGGAVILPQFPTAQYVSPKSMETEEMALKVQENHGWSPS